MNILHALGWLSGMAGAIICLASVGLRLAGAYWIGGFQTGTLLLGGIAAMVFGCFCLLAWIVRRI